MAALGQTDEAAPPDAQEGEQAYTVEPDGRIKPRFRAFAPQLVPPAPSDHYRRDPGYASRQSWTADSTRRGIANHRAWEERHGQAANEVMGWLADGGLLGDNARTAYRALTASGRIRRQADANVTAARARADQTRAEIAAGVRQALAGNGQLPVGGPVISGRLELEACELIAELVRASAPGVQRAWGDALNRADWRQALAQAETLEGPEAETAVAWLRAKVSPPPGPTADPLGWI
jgi:hypothetical protein